MSFRDCIEAALADRRFGPKKTEQILERYENLREGYLADGHDDLNADRMAAEEAVKREDIAIREAKKRKLAHAAKVIEVDERLDRFKAPDDLARAPMAWIDGDDAADWADYVSMQDRVRGQAHGMLAGLIDKYGWKGLGLRRKTAGLNNTLREIFTPNSTGDSEAAAFAKAWRETAAHLVRRFNAAGGTLAERLDWYLPQKMNRFKLTQAGEDAFVRRHMDGNWLYWEKMRYPDGRKIPFGERETALREAFRTLKTNGYNKSEDFSAAGRSLGNQLEQSRFLVYRDAESWLAMHEAYGDGNIFDVLMDHVDTMAHQVAMVEAFGPNPDLMKEVIKGKVMNRLAQRDVGDGELRTAKAEKVLRNFDDMFAIINRETSIADTDRIGNFLAGTRNYLTSSYLGSAYLVALGGDIKTTIQTAVFNRTPVMKTLGRYLSMMNPASDADRQLAIRSGLIAENAVQLAYAQTRLTGIESYGPMLTRRFSDIVMRASLLSPHTTALRWAFQMETMGLWADSAGKAYNDLPFVDMLRRHGIDEADWDSFRAIAPFEKQGALGAAKFLRPDDLYTSGMDRRQAEQLADKFMILLHKEGKYAVMDATVRGLMHLRGATRPGTASGEIASSFAMFKNMPVTILLTHGRRGMMQRGLSGKIGYLGAYALGMTAVGALAIQMRQPSQGKDFRDMTDPRFMGEALLVGGALGVWGDFFFSDLNRFGGGPVQTAAGPLVGFLADGVNLTVGNTVQATQALIDGEDVLDKTNLPAETVQFLRRNTPGTSLWWARLLLERELWDQLQEAADPKAYQKWRNRERSAERDYGQGFWWKPGTSLLEGTGPQRAPDMGAAVGQ